VCRGRLRDAVYLDEAKGFRVQLPVEGWEILELPNADLAVRDVRSPARIAVAASCPPQETGPLSVLARHLVFGLRQVERVRQQEILIDGVTGLETVLTGEWEGARVQVRTVVLQQQGCLYDLLFVAPPESFGTQSAAFDAFLEGWRFLRTSP
jgi:hypothetical protein